MFDFNETFGLKWSTNPNEFPDPPSYGPKDPAYRNRYLPLKLPSPCGTVFVRPIDLAQHNETRHKDFSGLRGYIVETIIQNILNENGIPHIRGASLYRGIPEASVWRDPDFPLQVEVDLILGGEITEPQAVMEIKGHWRGARNRLMHKLNNKLVWYRRVIPTLPSFGIVVQDGPSNFHSLTIPDFVAWARSLVTQTTATANTSTDLPKFVLSLRGLLDYGLQHRLVSAEKIREAAQGVETGARV